MTRRRATVLAIIGGPLFAVMLGAYAISLGGLSCGWLGIRSFGMLSLTLSEGAAGVWCERDWVCNSFMRLGWRSGWRQCSARWAPRLELSPGSVAVDLPLWLPLAGMLAASIPVIRTIARRPASQCCSCGYDLSGTPSRGVCPECGKEPAR
jgi:hypothetical protein